MNIDTYTKLNSGIYPSSFHSEDSPYNYRSNNDKSPSEQHTFGKFSRGISLHELIENMIKTLSSSCPYQIIEPMNQFISDESFEGMPNESIKLIGKIIDGEKYVILSFYDNSEKQE